MQLITSVLAPQPRPSPNRPIREFWGSPLIVLFMSERSLTFRKMPFAPICPTQERMRNSWFPLDIPPSRAGIENARPPKASSTRGSSIRESLLVAPSMELDENRTLQSDPREMSSINQRAPPIGARMTVRTAASAAANKHSDRERDLVPHFFVFSFLSASPSSPSFQDGRHHSLLFEISDHCLFRPPSHSRQLPI